LCQWVRVSNILKLSHWRDNIEKLSRDKTFCPRIIYLFWPRAVEVIPTRTQTLQWSLRDDWAPDTFLLQTLERMFIYFISSEVWSKFLRLSRRVIELKTTLAICKCWWKTT
jgi:hypothetical protein